MSMESALKQCLVLVVLACILNEASGNEIKLEDNIYQNIVIDSVVRKENVGNEMFTGVEKINVNMPEINSIKDYNNDGYPEMPLDYEEDNRSSANLIEIQNLSPVYNANGLTEPSSDIFFSNGATNNKENRVDASLLGASLNLEPPTSKPNNNKKKKSIENETVEELAERYLISAFTHIILALNGLFLLLYGFRNFRASMIMLGFQVAYYIIIIIIAHTPYFRPNKLSHEMGMLLISLSFGFLFMILTFLFESVNYFVFGSAVGVLVSIFYAQFFLDFSSDGDKYTMLGIYLIIAAVAIVAGKLHMRYALIASCSLIGSISLTINVGILTGDFVAFEDREKLSPDAYDDFVNYSIATSLMFVSGVLVQHFLRQRMIYNFSNRKLEEIRGVSFLE